MKGNGLPRLSRKVLSCYNNNAMTLVNILFLITHTALVLFLGYAIGRHGRQPAAEVPLTKEVPVAEVPAAEVPAAEAPLTKDVPADIAAEKVVAAAQDIDVLLDAIHMVESSGRTTDIPRGDGGLARGPFQIHESFWKDAMGDAPYSGADNVAAAKTAILRYWGRYCPEALTTFSRTGFASAWSTTTLLAVFHLGPRGRSAEEACMDDDYRIRVMGAVEAVR